MGIGKMDNECKMYYLLTRSPGPRSPGPMLNLLVKLLITPYSRLHCTVLQVLKLFETATVLEVLAPRFGESLVGNTDFICKKC